MPSAAEGHRAAVDGPTPRVVGLVLCVLVGSLVDAVLTLEHLQRGGSEANPLMALALTYGPTAFLGLKMGLSGVGAWVLAAYQQFPLALRGLHGLAVVYGLLLVCHVVLRVHAPQ
jgi:formate hydrogenlyase subunit 3/multisubunit Na+/H+ antiporter MnhD subunit